LSSDKDRHHRWRLQ